MGRERKGLASVHVPFFGQNLFLLLRSVITGLVPGFPFRVVPVHINLKVFRGRRVGVSLD